jgi:hypothetical protein
MNPTRRFFSLAGQLVWVFDWPRLPGDRNVEFLETLWYFWHQDGQKRPVQ